MSPMPSRSLSSSNDFSKGSVAGNILRLALPMTVAQIINVLYSVVDRMYIGPRHGLRQFVRHGRLAPVLHRAGPGRL